MEPDELYTLRAQYWLGHYKLCLEEAKSISRRTQLKAERDEFVLRAQLALGQYDRVAKESAGPDKSPAIRALGMHAAYDTSRDSASRERTIDALRLLAADPDCANSSSFQLFASHLFLRHGLTREALQCVHLGTTMEHLAVSLQIYLRIDRPDLAEGQLGLMRQADEDSVLTQLCSANLGIATGRSAVDDAIHTLGGLSEQYGPSVMLLNTSATAYLVAGRYEKAEAALVEALREDPANADTLINTIVCHQQQGKGMASVMPLIAKLKDSHPDHEFVKGLERVETAFDRESAKYTVKA